MLLLLLLLLLLVIIIIASLYCMQQATRQIQSTGPVTAVGKDGGSAKSEIAKYSVSGNEIYINKFLEKKYVDW